MNIVWLKRDLRIQDNGPLYTASMTEKVIVYIFEPERMQNRIMANSRIYVDLLVNYNKTYIIEHSDCIFCGVVQV